MLGAFTIYAIKSAICLALLYLPYTLLMRRDTFHAFNRVLLLSIVVLSLVMPLFKPLSFLPQGEMISQPIKSLEEAINPLSIEEETDGGFSSIEVETEEVFSSLESLPVKGNQGGNLQVSIEEDSGQIPWPTILVLIYIIGVVVCIAWKAFQLVRLYRYIPSNCLWKDTIDGIQVYAHFDEVCPFSWMNTIVITDEDFKNNPSVMQHERAHIRLHHSWDNFFVSAVEVLQWFNPCIWMLDYSLREVHEYEADASVLSHGVTLQNYQSLLIRKAIGTSSYAFANGFNHSLLTKRIRMMMKSKSNRWSCTKAVYLLPVAAIALAAFATPEFTEKANAVSESVPSISSLKEDIQLSLFNGEGADAPSSIEDQPIEDPTDDMPEVENTTSIKPGDMITGIVVDENDVPIQGAYVVELGDDGRVIWVYGEPVTEADINGHFSYRIHDPAHILRIGLVSQGFRATNFEPYEIKATNPMPKIVLRPEAGRTAPPVVATGTVTDTKGKPLIDTRIYARDENDGIIGITHPDNNGHFALRAPHSIPVRSMQIVCDRYNAQVLQLTNEPMKIVMETLEEADINRQPAIVIKGKAYHVNGVEFSMVAVEGGSFKMGGGRYDFEKPVHEVKLTSFSICQTEVTQELWEAVMGSNPSNYKGLKFPVENVSWDDCQTFITKLNQLTGQHFRLPTEAEWEYAARGGNQSNGYAYSGSNSFREVGWCRDNSRGRTHVVATKAPNELGLYDMSGNVWEWCQDWGDGSYYASSPINNPTGPSSGTTHIVRGGAWNDQQMDCRVEHRIGRKPTSTSELTGFRLAL